jgi:hypothetical protein
MLKFLVCYYALPAPASPNTGPWKFAVTPVEIRILADKTHPLHVADADRRDIASLQARPTRWLLPIIWASPYTALGLLLGAIAVLSGGSMRRRARVIECWGGVLTWVLRRLPLAQGVAAITLGHTILGQSEQLVERCRRHEMVHVGQYERWGPCFIPAYLLCSLFLAGTGRHGYLDNPFEREAYRQAAGASRGCWKDSKA